MKDRVSARWRRVFWTGAVLLVLFTIVGFFIAPPVLKSQLEQRATAALGRQVKVGKVRVNPYALSVTLENVDVHLKEGEGSFLGWTRLYVNFDAWASLRQEWVLGAIELDGFHITALLKPDGTFNFADILDRLAAAQESKPEKPATAPARPLRIGSLKVADARLDFADQSRSRPFATTLGPVTFSLTEFRTRGDNGAPAHFDATTEAGERIEWTGMLSADPLGSKGELRLGNIKLPKYAAYYADATHAELVKGVMELRLAYEARFAGETRVARVTGGELHLRDLRLTERDQKEAALELPAVDVTAITADAITRKFGVDAVKITGGHVRAQRRADGTIDVVTMWQPREPAAVPAAATSAPPAATTPAAGTAPAAPLPEFLIGEVSAGNLAVDFHDAAAARPAQIALSQVEFSVRNVTLAPGAELPVKAAVAWAPRGTAAVEGKVALKPDLRAELQVDVRGLDLGPLSPYLEQFVNARLTQGALTVKGTAQLAPAAGSPAISYAGEVALDEFGLVDTVNNEDLAGFAHLRLTDLKVETAPVLGVTLAEVALDQPRVHVLVNADRSLNLAALSKTPAPAAAGQPAPAPAPGATSGQPSPKISVAKVTITDGMLRFDDRSMQPAVQSTVSPFGGTIAGLSSENLGKADLDLKATVNGAGPVAISGKIDALGARKFADLKLDLKNVDLSPLSPYSARFAGYELARGKLALGVTLKLDAKQLDAANLLTLHQFTFGAPVQSPDATKLPVRLAVALLKNLNGDIEIDLPVAGNLEDPSFRVGKVVVQVILNLLTKAAVSPFALLGSMFGGGGDELAFQEFAPGASELQPTELPKLQTMVKALTNRPGLSVAVEGNTDEAADTFVLRQQKLATLVRSKLWEERRATDPTVPPPEKMEITADANAAMVQRLYAEKFPAGTEFGAPLAKAPVVAAAPPPPKRSMFRKVVDVVTLKRIRQEKKDAAVTAEAKAPAGGAVEPTGPSLEEMTGRLAETMTVNADDLRSLATARAARVRDYFVNEGKIDPERLFLAQSDAKAGENKGPRVFLNLQ